MMPVTNDARGDEIKEGDEVDTYRIKVTTSLKSSPNPSVILGQKTSQRVKAKEPQPTRSVSCCGRIGHVRAGCRVKTHVNGGCT